MPDTCANNDNLSNAVCIHTDKIFDSCRDKDCIEDLRVYPTCGSQQYIDEAVSIRAKSAELIFVAIDVEEVTFNRGYFTVDVRYFYKIKAEAFMLVNHSKEITGLAVFDKRVILFGSEGSAKVFSSKTVLDGRDIQKLPQTNLPYAVVEAVDPIILSIKAVEVCDIPQYDKDPMEVPLFIQNVFTEPLATVSDTKRLYVTLGQFSIIRLERDTQLAIPVYSYCIPEKECADSNDDDPCDIFRRINFPIDEFFPPSEIDNCNDTYREARAQISGNL